MFFWLVMLKMMKVFLEIWRKLVMCVFIVVFVVVVVLLGLLVYCFWVFFMWWWNWCWVCVCYLFFWLCCLLLWNWWLCFFFLFWLWCCCWDILGFGNVCYWFLLLVVCFCLVLCLRFEFVVLCRVFLFEKLFCIIICWVWLVCLDSVFCRNFFLCVMYVLWLGCLLFWKWFCW